MTETRSRLFPALLKYWRGRRGLSQLDLSLTAGISARHVSFLETGRSAPSVEMVMLLGGTLDLPLRDRNHLLRAAGFEPLFDEPDVDALDDPVIARAIERMLRQQEPFPMFVMNAAYDVLRINGAAARLYTLATGEVPPKTFNAIRVVFEPGPLRDSVAHWDDAAREMVSRLHREVLHRPEDEALASVLEDVLTAPGVPEDWQRPDFGRGISGVFPLQFELAGARLSFLTTVMRFQAPQNVTLDELQIESWFPMDDATETACGALIQTAKP